MAVNETDVVRIGMTTLACLSVSLSLIIEPLRHSMPSSNKAASFVGRAPTNWIVNSAMFGV